MTDFAVEYDVALDVMDAAVNRCLSRYPRGFVEIVRKEVTHGSVVYYIGQVDLGAVGEIRLDKLSEKRVEVHFKGPGFRNQLFTPEQKRAFFEGNESLEKRMIRLLSVGLGQATELFDRRKQHWKDVVDGLLQRLDRERIWLDVQQDNGVKEIYLQTKPAGRKVDPWNPIAYDILNDGGENAEIRAFDYWCKEQGVSDPGRRERDSFKKAMKRMAERRRRNR